VAGLLLVGHWVLLVVDLAATGMDSEIVIGVVAVGTAPMYHQQNVTR
jgi:hypothetical protein